MPKKTYNKKPQAVEAIQLTLSNLDEVRAFVAEHPTDTRCDFIDSYPTKEGLPGLFIYNEGRHPQDVFTGDIVYRLPSGQITAAREDVFFSVYE